MKGGDDPANRGFFLPEPEAEELVSHYTALGRLRAEHKALRLGDTEISSEGGVITVTRALDDDRLTLTVDTDSLEYSIK